MRAAEMISDAENALRMLEECENEDDFCVLRIACITILRSVGHVLGKVDHENKCLAASIDSWWKNMYRRLKSESLREKPHSANTVHSPSC